MIKIALVDDHVLLRNGLAAVINSFGEYTVLFEADDGAEFIKLLKEKGKPDIVLLDINMPKWDGFETANWIKNNEPEIIVLVLTMMDNETAIIRMLKEGAKGYILKDSKPEVLKAALTRVKNNEFFFNELVTGKLIHRVNQANSPAFHNAQLSIKETDFLKLCCTEKSYKEIAVAMQISPRAVEALRSNLFEKLHTASRVGLAMYAIKNGMVTI